jgi:hypothetical protein
VILQQVPGIAAEFLPMNLGVGAQSRLQIGHAIP